MAPPILVCTWHDRKDFTLESVVMPAVGFKSVDTSAPQMGDFVVVVGCGLIGLGVIATSRTGGKK